MVGFKTCAAVGPSLASGQPSLVYNGAVCAAGPASALRPQAPRVAQPGLSPRMAPVGPRELGAAGGFSLKTGAPHPRPAVRCGE